MYGVKDGDGNDTGIFVSQHNSLRCLEVTLNDNELNAVSYMSNHSSLTKHRIRHYKVDIDVLVRLVGGSSSQEGRLEVLQNGVWGGVCYNINDAAARVVCSMLGFG